MYTFRKQWLARPGARCDSSAAISTGRMDGTGGRRAQSEILEVDGAVLAVNYGIGYYNQENASGFGFNGWLNQSSYSIRGVVYVHVAVCEVSFLVSSCYNTVLLYLWMMLYRFNLFAKTTTTICIITTSSLFHHNVFLYSSTYLPYSPIIHFNPNLPHITISSPFPPRHPQLLVHYVLSIRIYRIDGPKDE